MTYPLEIQLYFKKTVLQRRCINFLIRVTVQLGNT